MGPPILRPPGGSGELPRRSAFAQMDVSAGRRSTSVYANEQSPFRGAAGGRSAPSSLLHPGARRVQPPQRAVAAEELEHVEDPRARGAPDEGEAERLRHLPE